MKLKAVIRAILIALVILSGAIALPILFRPFYWWHIKPYGIPEYMDMTIAQIKQAYGEMLDYCMGLSGSFSVGVLPFSQSGADHFADVRNLFILDLAVLVIAGIDGFGQYADMVFHYRTPYAECHQFYLRDD